MGFSLHRPSVWSVRAYQARVLNTRTSYIPLSQAVRVSQSSLSLAGIHWSQQVPTQIGNYDIVWRKCDRLKTSSWFGGDRSFYTCHLHTSFPSESSFTAMKSISPRLTPLQFPLEDPARITELSSPETAALNVSFRPVPSCRVTGNIANWSRENRLSSSPQLSRL